MRNNKNGMTGKGLYIALILCAAAIGVTGYVYARNANQVQSVSLQTELVEKPAPTEARPVPTIPTEAPTAPKRILKTAAPVDGISIGSYAMDCLSYNATTRDWRVHDGIDFAAEAGSEVHAAAEGTVYSVQEDDAMGYTVTIRHEGGYTTQYANLSDALCVAQGDSVQLGQTIGVVGASALLESAMDSHVHFSVTCMGKSMDPEEFLSIGE